MMQHEQLLQELVHDTYKTRRKLPEPTRCADCGAVQYPPREACCACVSPRLKWRPQTGAGQLLATTTLHHSNDLFFRDKRGM